MTEELVGKLLVAAVGGGFAVLTAVVGFFARRLVQQQDRHAEILGSHDRQIVALDTRVQHLELEQARAKTRD